MKQLFQILKPGKLFLPVIAFAISLTTSAQPYFQKQEIQFREIELFKAFNEIEVSGDVTIILTNNLENKIIFRGYTKDLLQARASVKNGKLLVDVNRQRRHEKFTVYLPVSGISSLITSGKTEVRSAGTIKIQDLEILLNGSSLVSINHDGKLKVTPGAGYEIVSARN